MDAPACCTSECEKLSLTFNGILIILFLFLFKTTHTVSTLTKSQFITAKAVSNNIVPTHLCKYKLWHISFETFMHHCLKPQYFKCLHNDTIDGTDGWSYATDSECRKHNLLSA